MSTQRVAVLYGGRADEHSISCISAASLLRAIDRERFEPVPIGITRAGEWVIDDVDPRSWSLDNGDMPTVEMKDSSRRVVLDVSRGGDGFFVEGDGGRLESLGHIDVVFPVLHGPYGEDGTIQGLLEMMNVAYVGCGVFASSACMDKHYTKILLAAAGVPVAPGITVDARDFDDASHFAANQEDLAARVKQANLAYPLFVKPSRAGSSFGVSKVERPEDLAEAVYEAAPHDWRVLIEQGIDGREIECAVLAATRHGKPRTSWPGEVVLDARNSDDDAFYDFDSKYTDSSASHVEVPARLPQETLQQVREVAAEAFTAVDGEGLARVDTFVLPSGEVMVNEINTMPGFTSISMYPRAWEASGMPYQKVISELIEGVLE
ncbi:MAG: D-alanine--D-alanine ligase [Bifidobacteriaceae bacterium]|jgi:D-alanine-D-alanine ligase|nr:D-alanine--D-alanine ligase [Bifidobacteriaceae bacterium]MCI1914284.1 D-alanine--D-alanine ligase [Bifidobacteriaceae bacterium]